MPGLSLNRLVNVVMAMIMIKMVMIFMMIMMVGYGYDDYHRQALSSTNIPLGALGLRLTSANDEEAHIHDSL